MRITELLEANDPQAAFVNQHYDTAKEVGDQLGVDPKLILGHWALETGWGKSVIPGTNNLGNIMDFSGKGVKAVDNQTGKTDAYRQYASTSDSAKDYASLLARKYPNVVGAGSDPDAFVNGLQGGKYKYAGDNFAQVYAGMPASVEKYLGKDRSWTMDPSKIMAKIQNAPDDVKNYISSKYGDVKKFVSSLTDKGNPELDPEELKRQEELRKKRRALAAKQDIGNQS